MLQELVPGVKGSVPFPRYFIRSGRNVFFLADDLATGEEWWGVPARELD
ncbi:hypothetical protein HV824_07000 [Myxococcus sp. AM009]|nr:MULTISPECIES: hypothetical protein [unclassified Myxococcus]NVI97868.1 hypothetical protein [Myxococcus sp. AM009]NVJ15448.1 hypothetical protein [Myxococcus sp. AM010]